MNAARPHPEGNVVRYQRASRPALSLRLEGSLAAVVPLAPVIPIFPALTLAAAHRATSAECHAIGGAYPWPESKIENRKSKI
jgi:hypothetical protein